MPVLQHIRIQCDRKVSPQSAKPPEKPLLIPCCSFPNRFLSFLRKVEAKATASVKGPAICFFGFSQFYSFCCSIQICMRWIETTYNIELPATLPCPPDRPPTSVSSVTSTIPSLDRETGALNRTHPSQTRRKQRPSPGRPGDEPDSPRDPLSPFLQRPIQPIRQKATPE